jgi:hypothetical protein
MSVERLHPADLEQLADLIAERLAERHAPTEPPRLVDAATLAAILGVTRSTIYDRADDLGAVRLGDGPKARIRFDVERARAALEAERRTPTDSTPARPPQPRRQRRQPTAGQVLHVGGREAR